MTKKTKINSEEFVKMFFECKSAEELAEHFGVDVKKVYSFAAYLRKHVGVELPSLHSISKGSGRRRGRPSEHDKNKLNELVKSYAKKQAPSEKEPKQVEVSVPSQNSGRKLSVTELMNAFDEAVQLITKK